MSSWLLSSDHGNKGNTKRGLREESPLLSDRTGDLLKKNALSRSIMTQHLTLSNLNDENVEGVTVSAKLRSKR